MSTVWREHTRIPFEKTDTWSTSVLHIFPIKTISNQILAVDMYRRCVWEYDTRSEKWIEHSAKGLSWGARTRCPTKRGVFDQNKNILYIYETKSTHGAMWHLDISDLDNLMWNKSTNKTKQKINPEGTWSIIKSKPIFIGIAKDEQQKQQWIYDDDKWSSSEINFNGEYNGIIGSKVIQISNKNNAQLLAFGGFSCNNIRNYHRGIWHYNLNVNGWTKLRANIPKQLQNFGICCINNKYVMIFGGYSNGKKSGYEANDDIYVYDIDNQVFTTSEIQCPDMQSKQVYAYDEVYGFHVEHNVKWEMIANGYTKKIWNESNLQDSLFPPQYLIKIIQGFYMQELVYLLNRYGRLWSIKKRLLTA